MAGGVPREAVEAAARAALEAAGGRRLTHAAGPGGRPRGALVAVEGVDGAGVTSVSHALAEALSAVGLRAVYTKEPTGGPAGALARRGLVEGWSGDELALAFALDRLWHLYRDPSLPGGRGVVGAMVDGFIVVSDRYKYTSLAYQGREAGVEWVWEVNSRAPPAHVLVYLRVDADTAWGRVARRGLGMGERYHDPSELKANVEALEGVVSRLSREPEYGPDSPEPPWARLEPGLRRLYPTPPAYPAVVVVDAGRPLEEAASQAAGLVVRALAALGVVEPRGPAARPGLLAGLRMPGAGPG